MLLDQPDPARTQGTSLLEACLKVAQALRHGVCRGIHVAVVNGGQGFFFNALDVEVALYGFQSFAKRDLLFADGGARQKQLMFQVADHGVLIVGHRVENIQGFELGNRYVEFFETRIHLFEKGGSGRGFGVTRRAVDGALQGFKTVLALGLLAVEGCQLPA